jgi:hypothetical protein
MHVPDVQQALSEMVRALRPGGRMAVRTSTGSRTPLPRLFREAGMTGVSGNPTSGEPTLAKAKAEGRFLYGFIAFIASGTKL